MRFDLGGSSLPGDAFLGRPHGLRLIRPASSSDLQLIRRFGGPVSHGAMNSRYRIFHVEGIDGLIGYLLEHRCAVVLGDPVCSSTDRRKLAAAFSRYCTEQGWTLIYAVASEDMSRLAKFSGYGIIDFAELLIADPQQDPEAGSRGKKLRWNLNRNRRQGVTVREYLGEEFPNSETEAGALLALRQWQAGRRGVQMSLGSPRLFMDKTGCRWFIAECDGGIVGVLYMIKVDCGGCRYLIDLVFSTPHAPQHTNELMVVTALRALREEGERSVSFGVGPRPELGEIHGFSPMSTQIPRRFYQLANRMVPQDGKTVFWEKFGVVRRESLYLLFEQPRVGLKEFRAILKTFNISMA